MPFPRQSPSHRHSRFLRVLCLSAVNVLPASAGDLNPPPGPIAPTHKTLTQVEPRIPVNPTNTPGDATASFIISQPGSYYLTSNLTGESGKVGIRITANNVTLDLMGFSLIGNNVGTQGILIPSFVTGVSITNGTVANWASHGINTQIDAGRIDRITATANGGDGIANRGGVFTTHITSCEAVLNLANGISAEGDTLIRDCVASLNGGAGMPGTAGILAVGRAIIESCTASSSSADAIAVSNNSVVRDCRASTSGGAAAIRAASRNRIERNSVTNSNVGLAVTGSRNIVRDNLVVSCSDAYQFGSGNDLNLILSDIPETIDWPASITLNGNLTQSTAGPGITINSSDVVLDFGGYALVGNGLQAPFNTGILLLGARANIVIRNGAIRNWGDKGVDLAAGRGITLNRLDVTSNLGDGIRGGSESIFTDCRASNNSGSGMAVGALSRVERCMAHSNGLHGFDITGGTTVLRCEAATNGTAPGSTGAGFFVGSAWVNGRIEDCLALANEIGFDIDGAGWIIIRNIARSNTTNFAINVGNNAGSTVASPAGAGANDNIAY